MNLSDLIAQLQQESNEAMQKAKQIEIDALSNFEVDLKRQCGSAASTLKSALEESQRQLLEDIRTYNSELKAALSADSKELRDQLATLKMAVAKWTPKLTLAVKVGVFLPITVTLVTCGLLVLGTYLWIPSELWNLRTSHQTLKDGRSYLVIEDPAWTTCNIADNPTTTKTPRPCKPIKTTSPNQ